MSAYGEYALETYVPDTKPFKGTWTSASSATFSERRGNPNVIRLTLQDGKQRHLDVSTSAIWDESNGVGDWGYDEAGSQVDGKWKYCYAVPESGDDDRLAIRVSDNPPTTGPAGYSSWELVWATYDSLGDLKTVYQLGNRFYYQTQRPASTLPFGFGWHGQWTDYVIDDVVPMSCGAVNIRHHVQHARVGTAVQALVVGPEGGGWLLACYAAGVGAYGHVAGQIPTPGVESKKISILNYTWEGPTDQILHQEVAILGWIDEWIEP